MIGCPIRIPTATMSKCLIQECGKAKTIMIDYFIYFIIFYS